MEHIILVRYGEIHLKGLNRPFFERKLIEGIHNALAGFGAKVRREQGRIYVLGVSDDRVEEACDNLTRVFGVHSVSRRQNGGGGDRRRQDDLQGLFTPCG